MSEPLHATASTSVLPIISAESATKKAGRPPRRRPRIIPLKLHDRMSKLGLQVRSRDTSEANLKSLIESLSLSLEQYSSLAEYWQNQTTSLQPISSHQGEPAEVPQEAGNEQSSTAAEYDPNTALNHRQEAEFVGRLIHTATSNLNYVSMELPNLTSSVYSAYSSAELENLFPRTLLNVSRIGTLFGVFVPSLGAWSNLARLKPDFSEARAREVWNFLFNPIDTAPMSLGWNSGPRSRCEEYRSPIIEAGDMDYDDMDRKLALSTDLEVLDMLHYCAILLMGLNHALYSEPEYAAARDHLGRQLERLLREAVFSRSLGSQAEYAVPLIVGITDTLYHFTALSRFATLHTLRDIAWASCASFPTAVHPILKGMILFQSAVWAPNQAARSMWMSRCVKNCDEAEAPFYHLTSNTYFTGCFVALVNRDLDSLLFYLTKLEQSLFPEAAQVGDRWASGMLTLETSDSPSYSPSPSSSSRSPSSSPTPSFIASSLFQSDSEPDSLHTMLPREYSFTPLPSPPTASPIAPPPVPLPSSSLLSHCYNSIDQRISVPEQEGKLCSLSGLFMMRAEAALMTGDFNMCRHWVDQVEATILKLPDLIFLQYLFMSESEALGHAFSTPCPFPSGTHSIADELQYRLSLHGNAS